MRLSVPRSSGNCSGVGTATLAEVMASERGAAVLIPNKTQEHGQEFHKQERILRKRRSRAQGRSRRPRPCGRPACGATKTDAAAASVTVGQGRARPSGRHGPAITARTLDAVQVDAVE